MSYCSYHMHTTFCDGANTPEEMVLASIEAGCPEIGFSGHSFLIFDDEWTMVPAKAAEYRETVHRLAEKYADKISIRLGIEQDYCSPTDELGLYDYVIGGVHCLFPNGPDGPYVSVDLAVEELQRAIDEVYGGDPYAFAENYYETVADLYNRTHCNIIAHFDLCTKFIERGIDIDINSPRYIAAADKALDELLKTPAVFEINKGAVARGYRNDPYPDDRILKRLGESGHPVIISSDSHSCDSIIFGFEEAEKRAAKYHLNLLHRLP